MAGPGLAWRPLAPRWLALRRGERALGVQVISVGEVSGVGVPLTACTEPRDPRESAKGMAQRGPPKGGSAGAPLAARVTGTLDSRWIRRTNPSL